MVTRLRNYFLTGLVVAGPAGITLYLTWALVSWVDSWVKPYLPASYNPDTYLPFPVPGFGLVVGVVLIMTIGFLTANIVGRTLFGYSEHMLHRMPVVRNLYRGLKQIFETVLAERGSSFQTAVLLEYPRRGLWTIGFVAGPTRGEVRGRLPVDEEAVTVFVPTTPNPTGGFLLFLPRRETIALDMTVEDAAKLVISFGLVSAETGEVAKERVETAAKRVLEQA
ncbi:DUF502 domain-containing protein [Chthonobacter rhizosphaerae]|uniref:DUF502 domain-containing protein n=1 Tax=Chthonobacter rhizosphaerae TaxID=2735553 RepID=UPI0015EFAD0C|nr:DUF502 domain-containing protein [Chthonobacter rhizosphaerae]